MNYLGARSKGHLQPVPRSAPERLERHVGIIGRRDVHNGSGGAAVAASPAAADLVLGSLTWAATDDDSVLTDLALDQAH